MWKSLVAAGALAACAGTQSVGGDARGVDAATADAAPTVQPFGATVEAGGVGFRVWAPHATAASVVIGGVATAMDAGPDASFIAHVAGAAAGASYVYRLVSPAGSVDRLDPYGREIADDGSASIVVDPAAYAWGTPSFVRPARAASVVYELHVGSFTADGTLAAARARLADLAALGIDVVELMPVQAFGGAGHAGWGYNPQLYFAPKPALGSATDVRAFIDEAHRLGIAVWLDVVFNHTDSWSKAPLRCFDGYCPGNTAGVYFFSDPTYATTPWGPRPDYTEPAVAAMILASLDAWIGELHADGFRWDSVSNIRALDGQGTVPGGAELLRAATDRAHAAGATSIAEDLKGYAAITAPTSGGGFGFDAQWDGFGYDIDALLANSSDAARDLGVVAGALTGGYGGDPFARLLFVEDHDTVGNGGARLPSKIDPAQPESFAARRRAMLGGVLLMTTPGVPMLFMGQEQLATGTFASPAVPLAAPDAAGVKMAAFYRDLIRLRRNLDGGAAGLAEAGVEIVQRNDGAKVIAYRRYGASGQDVLVLVNLSSKAYTTYDVGVADPGPWRIRLTSDRAAYGDDFPVGPTGALTAVAGAKDGKAYTLSIPVGAYGAVVLTR